MNTDIVVADYILKRLRILEEIAYAACDFLDSHDEIVGETCKTCVDNEKTCGEFLGDLLDDFTHERHVKK